MHLEGQTITKNKTPIGVLPMTNEVRIWKKREGHIKESVWLTQGIRIYRKILNHNPEDMECKAELAKLLIRTGTDEKMKYINLMKAQDLFAEVLDLFPNDAEALYRLGHISYEMSEYERSITYFTKALEQPLSDTRAFRSYSTLSKACYHLGDDENALSFLQKAKEMDQERNFTSDINEVEHLITEEGLFKRTVRYPDGTYQLITIEQAESLKAETAEKGEADLDLSHFHPTFTGPKDDARLERKEAEILCYLIERDQRFISKEELLNIWEEGEAPELDTIKSYISKIKRKIGTCFPEDHKPVILTKWGEGYKWSSKLPTTIIKVQ